MRAETAALRIEAARAASETAALRIKAAARDSAIRAELAALRVSAPLESPSVASYATVGAEALADLELCGRVTAAAAPAEGASAAECAPIASAADLERLGPWRDKKQFVAAIAPLLRAARGLEASAADPCPRILVNSERTPWLDSLRAPLRADQLKRPDLFTTWAPFVSGRLAADGSAEGGLAARALQLDGCVCEFYEAKLGSGNLTPTDFGQLMDYHSRVRGMVRGMLFNERYFWLYESLRERPMELTKGELCAPGSQALLRRFFNAGREPKLVLLLRHLLLTLRMAPLSLDTASLAAGGGGGGSDASKRTSAYLSSGGSARVFCVAAEGAPSPYALKVCTTLSCAELNYEFSALQRAAALGAPVVPVVEGSLTFMWDGEARAYRGGGFLLRDVCTRAVVHTRKCCAAAFEALRALHAVGISHGDARLPNLLRRRAEEGGALLWIDMREAVDGEQGGGGRGAGALGAAQRADAGQLAASVMGAESGGKLAAPVQAALAGVPGDAAAYAALATAVSNALHFP